MTDTATIEQPASPTAEDDSWEWCFLEIMGHRSHWGRARQEERFGAKMIRIDVPSFRKPAAGSEAASDAPPLEMYWTTHYYGGASIFSYSLTDEATVMKRNKPYEPPSRLSLPAPAGDDDLPFDDGGPYNEGED